MNLGLPILTYEERLAIDAAFERWASSLSAPTENTQTASEIAHDEWWRQNMAKRGSK